ncbi:MAG: hypothetical protein WAZ99_04920 [Rectinemataceae bacterium]
MSAFPGNFLRALVLLAGLSLPAGILSAQSMNMDPAMPPQPQMAPQVSMSAQTTASLPMQADPEFLVAWDRAMESVGIHMESRQRLVDILRESAEKLKANRSELAQLREKEAAAPADAHASIGKRIKLAESERELLIVDAETAMRDFLNPEQVGIVMAAGFHGTAPGHSDAGHGMGDAMDMTDRVSEAEELAMRLGDFAAKMNSGFVEVSLEVLIDHIMAE